jgi:hypothetical protein
MLASFFSNRCERGTHSNPSFHSNNMYTNLDAFLLRASVLPFALFVPFHGDFDGDFEEVVVAFHGEFDGDFEEVVVAFDE